MTAAILDPAPHWPYPFWIAHRGAGHLAPENTMAAFQLGAQHGFRMFECDAKLSADGVLYLLHDEHLDRTTNQQGSPAALSWQALSQLDAGSWHSSRYRSEPLTRLDSLLQWCQTHRHCLNIEIKPLHGQDRQTSMAVGQLLEAMAPNWPQDLPWPLVSSFSVAALEALPSSQAPITKALLIEHWPEDIWQQLERTKAAALIGHYPLWNQERVQQLRARGLRALSYTVNTIELATGLRSMHTDGIITDAIDLLGP